jgi:transcription initiation factor TFIIIB Brf1 subunit/transcription initiation factor TFIIB
MSKKMCKSDKEEDFLKAKYSCKKCGMVSAKEKYLCKPKNL